MTSASGEEEGVIEMPNKYLAELPAVSKAVEWKIVPTKVRRAQWWRRWTQPEERQPRACRITPRSAAQEE
jgi:hypothetical protein